jgi:hypothetical protein
MRKRELVVLVASSMLVSSSALAKPKRDKIECAKASSSKLAPGWGKLPAALQKLPPGATLCGVSGDDNAFILSALDSKALEAFYAPLFATVGCKPLTCKTDQFKLEVCACPKDKSGFDTGYIQLHAYDQAYQLFFSSHKP